MAKQSSPNQKTLAVWGMVLLIWSLYRAKFALPSWVDEFIIKPFVFIGAPYIYLVHREKKDFFDATWLQTKGILAEILFGISAGSIIAFVITVVGIFSSFSFTQRFFVFNIQTLVPFFLIALATAISEEILSRGFVLKRLHENMNNKYLAIFYSSLLFIILHIPILLTNVKITGGLLIFFMVTDLILSFINSIVFLERKSLISPILIHAFYTMSLVFLV